MVKQLFRRKVRTVLPKTQNESPTDRVYRLRMAYREMIYRHKVSKYPGRIALIVNEKQYKLDKKMGWKGVAAGGLEIHCTPGDHWTRYTTYGKDFAERLSGCIERAHVERAKRKRHSLDGPNPKQQTRKPVLENI